MTEEKDLRELGLNEILKFLKIDTRMDLQVTALQYILGLSGSYKGCTFLTSSEDTFPCLTELLFESNSDAIREYLLLTLVNLTATEIQCTKLTAMPNCVMNLLKLVLDQDNARADTLCMLLSNLSRYYDDADKIVAIITENYEDIGFDKIVQAFGIKEFNKKGAKLDFLGSFLANLTQNISARRFILDKTLCTIQRIFPFTQYAESDVRRRAAVAILRNCCFETEYHEWLLSEHVDILPHLLLPLAGPEEYDEEDMNKLPIDLQYLEPNKQRESKVDIRKMLIEALTQLCATSHAREYFRKKNVYVICKNLHEWEEDKEAKLAIEYVVGVLIEEPDHDNLKDLDVPQEYADKFIKAKEDFLKSDDTE